MTLWNSAGDTLRRREVPPPAGSELLPRMRKIRTLPNLDFGPKSGAFPGEQPPEVWNLTELAQLVKPFCCVSSQNQWHTICLTLLGHIFRTCILFSVFRTECQSIYTWVMMVRGANGKCDAVCTHTYKYSLCGTFWKRKWCESGTILTIYILPSHSPFITENLVTHQSFYVYSKFRLVPRK